MVALLALVLPRHPLDPYLSLILWPLAGYSWGAWMWISMERMYHKQMSELSTSDDLKEC